MRYFPVKSLITSNRYTQSITTKTRIQYGTEKTQNHSVSESSSTSVGVFTNISPDSLRVSAKETSTPSDFQQLLLKEFKRAEEAVKKCKKVRTTTVTLITREDAIGNEEQHA